MVPVFSYIFKVKYILIRVQGPVVALIVTRNSLKQTGPKSNPDIEKKKREREREDSNFKTRENYIAIFFNFLTWRNVISTKMY
jgi:hypothetical protein